MSNCRKYDLIISSKPVDEQFINDHYHDLDLTLTYSMQKISPEYMRKHIDDRSLLYFIVLYQSIPEDILYMIAERCEVLIPWIIMLHKVSIQFIVDHIHDINIKDLFKYQKFTKDELDYLWSK